MRVKELVTRSLQIATVSPNRNQSKYWKWTPQSGCLVSGTVHKCMFHHDIPV